MDDATTATAAAPWRAPEASAAATPAKRRFDPARLIPFIGPLALFIVWDLAVRLGLIKAILLPPPLATLQTLVVGLAGGPLLTDFAVTVWRTLEAFAISAIVGVPLGVLLGSNERALSQRGVPDRLLPLDAVVRADPVVPAHLRRVGREQGGDRRLRRVLIVVFNSAYGVLNARSSA